MPLGGCITGAGLRRAGWGLLHRAPWWQWSLASTQALPHLWASPRSQVHTGHGLQIDGVPFHGNAGHFRFPQVENRSVKSSLSYP